jgi:2-keto-4-pentenoate hydratase
VVEIQVDGHLDEHWACWLGDARVVRNDDGTTTFVATVADQAAVHGVLAGLRDLGVTLLALRTLDPG